MSAVNFGGVSSNPFTLLSNQSASYRFWDSSTQQPSLISITPQASTTSTKFNCETYVEGAWVSDQNSLGARVGFNETSHTAKYFRGFHMWLYSDSNAGAFNAPNGDDICLSFSRTHNHAVSGSSISLTLNPDTDRSHAVCINL